MKTKHQNTLLWRAALLVFAAFSCLLAIAERGTAAPARGMRAPAHFTIADFDGDSRPDLARVQVGQSSSRNTRYWIAFQLSGGSAQTVSIIAPTGGLRITSRDVNGDTFPDVVVTTAWTNRPIAILLNDGSGKFTPLSPSSFQSAFAAPETSCSSPADEIKDATALLSRSTSGNCPMQSTSSSPRIIAALHASYSSAVLVLASVLPFIGRAPPFSSL
jgi:hypothetical protein